MKPRIMLLVLLIFAGVRLSAQPPETVLPGTPIPGTNLQSLPLASDGPFPLGFSFTFFGNSYTEFYVSANGLVTFADPNGFYNTEAPIPTAAAPNNYIAPFWDNLYINDVSILYTTIGAAPNRKCIIQYTNMSFDPITTPFGTFLVVLYESSNNIQIQYRLIVDPYSEKSHGLSATIGLENAGGNGGVQYAYHNGSAIVGEQAILFTPSGGTYNVNPSAAYEEAFLTSNFALPDPSIVTLISPPPDAVVGTSHTFQWSASTNAASYLLLTDTFPDFSSASNYNAGLNLSYTVPTLKANKTWYWVVFASNATATTWCEASRFTTTAAPPLSPVPQTIWTEQLTDKSVKLQYTGGDASAKTAVITTLPAQGELYQYNAGARGAQILSVPTDVTDASMNIIYAATGTTGNGVGNFKFKIRDGSGESSEATITLNVSPPGVPDVLYVAKGTGVEIQFDIDMANPSGKEAQFIVKVNGTTVPATNAALKQGDPKCIVLTLSTPLTGGEPVTVAYTQGDVTGYSGGLLFSFTATPVVLLSQTINFSQTLDLKYSDSPVSLVATSSGGLPVTYTSTNLSVATVSGNQLTLHTLGNSVITARQGGNGTYAPASFTKTLSVAKGDQFITFNPLPYVQYGSGDIDPLATSSSDLAVSYTSNNPLVATIVSGNIHIVGGGNATITATQAGNSLYNPATPADQLLVVNKIDLTFTAENKARVYGAPNPTFTFTIAGFINSETQTVLDQLPTAGTTATAGSDAGTYPITLTGGTDNNYNYIFVPGTLTIGQATQTISFVDLPVKIPIIKPFILEATSTANLPVTFESLNPAIASVTGTLLVGVSKGTATIRAYNNGNINWLPAEVSGEIEVLTSHSNIMNLFTPNNDGINDYWELPDMAEWGKCEVKVYDRRGKLVYDNKNYDNLWDGTSNGAPVPEGAYYYIIVTENNGTVKGTVNVVR